MFDRLNYSWTLLRASASVLRSDKQLIVFPIFSAIASLLVTATFFIPAGLYAWSHHFFTSGPSGAHSQADLDAHLHSPLGYVAMFLFYLTQYLVVFFANTALVGAALIRLRGGRPTISDGFGLAMRHIGAILGYAFIASTVGMAIRAVAERTGILGRLGMGLFGLAWNVATYLVAPILIMEDVGPIEAVKRSTGLLKRTWGEQIVGNIGLNTASSLLMLGLIAIFIPLVVVAISIESPALIIASVVLFVLAITALALIQAALTGIYTAAVYLYASEGFTGGPFDAEMIRRAFRAK